MLIAQDTQLISTNNESSKYFPLTFKRKCISIKNTVKEVSKKEIMFNETVINMAFPVEQGHDLSVFKEKIISPNRKYNVP